MHDYDPVVLTLLLLLLLLLGDRLWGKATPPRAPEGTPTNSKAIKAERWRRFCYNVELNWNNPGLAHYIGRYHDAYTAIADDPLQHVPKDWTPSTTVEQRATWLITHRKTFT